MKKLFLCPWFGEFPTWHAQYLNNIEIALKPLGYDFLIPTDIEEFKQRVKTKLGIDAPVTYGGTKVHDYRAALGHLYEEELAGYDFWGHTDFDCVYGKVDDFVSDEFLQGLDIHSDAPEYMCGPWSLYRNTERVNKLFMECPDWQSYLTDPGTSGWVEQAFSRLVERSGLRYKYTLFHAYTDPDSLYYREDGRLYCGNREVSMYHFRRTKVWPRCPTR